MKRNKQINKTTAAVVTAVPDAVPGAVLGAGLTNTEPDNQPPELPARRALAIPEDTPALALQLHVALPAAQQPAAVYLASLGSGSRRTMRGALDTLARLLTGGWWDEDGVLQEGRCDCFSLQWSELRFQHTAALRSLLAERFAPTTANKHLAALRGVMKAAWQLEQIDSEDYHRTVALPAVRGESLLAGRSLSFAELQALFNVCAKDIQSQVPAGTRDAALLAVLYGAGLRRAEAVALDLADYDSESGQITVRSGKGRKARLAYASNGSKEALDDWLQLRGLEAGPLFVPVLKSGRIVLRRLSDEAVRFALHKRTLQAGLKSLSPHDMRRSFISHLLDAGADIATVQKLAGHASVTTTARYDRRGEIAKQKAAAMLHVPFSR